MFQLKANLDVHLTQKRRNIGTTLCEFLSHFIILTLLVFGYQRSKIVRFSSQTYETIELQVPPSFINKNVNLANALLSTNKSSTGISSSGKANSFGNLLNFNDFLASFQALLATPFPTPSLEMYLTFAQLISKEAAGNGNVDLIDRTAYGQRFQNLFKMGVIHFAPYPSPLVDDYIKYMLNTTTKFKNVKYYTHSSEGSAVDFILNNLNERTFALIVFRDITNKKINYVIRQNYTALPNTNKMVSFSLKGLNSLYQKYYLNGFLSLQDSIDEWAFQYTGASHVSTTRPAALSSTCGPFPTVWSFPYPIYKYSQNPFYTQVGPLLGLAFTMTFLYPMSRLVKSIVEEKESKMREVLKIMGLNDSIHQLAWFIISVILFVWIAVSSTLYLKATFVPYSDASILFAYYFTFSLSLVTLSFLVSVFFSNAKLSAIAAPVVLIFTLLPKFIFFTYQTTEGVSAKIAASLLSPVAFGFGADILSDKEYNQVGIQYSNINEPGYNMTTAISMMFFDIFLYGLLAWYFNHVIPQEYGSSKHPLFFLFPSFWTTGWCCFKDHDIDEDEESKKLFDSGSGNNGGISSSSSSNNQQVISDGDFANNNDSFEPLTATQSNNVKIKMTGLRKQYSDGKIALKHLNLSIVSDQITCLLGHNGAGKSTTIALLTGMTAPTEGDCLIYGHSLSKHLTSIRQITGICPQQNVLYPSLTVQEHLRFIGSIKGLKFAKLKQAIDELISDVGLNEKRHVLSKALSGGMKRKLCLAMALIGDPKFVLLDEPTSGMDPYSRRAIWDLLQRKKANRVIMLTTHYLDEADIVSDRVAILSEGKLRCCGTSLFLKNRFGAGYVLSLTLDELADEYAGTGGSGGESRADTAAITHAIQAITPTASLVSEYAGELTYQLPVETAPLLGDLFKYLQLHSIELNIKSFGVSITSLEQVFIRLAQMDSKHDEADPTAADQSSYFNKCLKSIGWWERNSNNHTDMTPGLTTTSTGTGTGSGGTEVQDAAAALKSSNYVYSVENAGTMRNGEKILTYDGQLISKPSPAAAFESTARYHDLDHVHGDDGVDEETKDDGGEYKSVEKHSHSHTDIDVEGSNPMMIDSDLSDMPTKPSYALPSLPLPAATATATAFTLLDTSYDKDTSRHTAKTTLNDEKKGESGKDSSTLNSSRGLFWIQFKELLRKRWIVQKRDIKGFFFQILFPAIQILLILAILTIKINPAGHTVRMWGNSLGFTPTVLTGGATSTSTTSISQSLSTSRMLVNHMPALNDSTLMSDYLLSSYKRKHADRYASIIFDNRIPVNVTVDWDWVKANANAIFLVETATINQYLARIGPQDFRVKTSSLGRPQRRALNNFINLIPDNSNAAATNFYNKTLANLTTANAFLKSRFNVTISQAIFNILKRTTRRTIRFIPKQNQTFDIGANNGTIDVSFTSVQLKASTKSIVLTDVKLTFIINNQTATLSLGTIELPLSELLRLLPDGSAMYTLYIKAEYTVLHNTTSPHGVALFNGELRNAYFQTCSPASYSSKAAVAAAATAAESIATRKLNIKQLLEALRVNMEKRDRSEEEGEQQEEEEEMHSFKNLRSSSSSSSASFSSSTTTTTTTAAATNMNTNKMSLEYLSALKYVAKNHPLPLTQQQTIENQVLLSFLTSLFILIPLCYIPAAFVSFIVKERTSKAKHIQLVSSVSSNCYWMSTYAWDSMLFFCLACFIMVSFSFYGASASQVYIGSAAAASALFLLLVLYGLSILPLCYLYSMYFENHSTSQITITLINFFSGFIAVLAYFIMLNVPDTVYLAKILVWVFRLFPTYNIGEGMIAITTAVSYNLILGKHENVYAFKYAGQNLMYMALEAVGYFILVLMTELSVFRDISQFVKKGCLGFSSFLGFNTATSSAHDRDHTHTRETDKHIARRPLLDPTTSGNMNGSSSSSSSAPAINQDDDDSNDLAPDDMDADVYAEYKRVQAILKKAKQQQQQQQEGGGGGADGSDVSSQVIDRERERESSQSESHSRRAKPPSTPRDSGSSRLHPHSPGRVISLASEPVVTFTSAEESKDPEQSQAQVAGTRSSDGSSVKTAQTSTYVSEMSKYTLLLDRLGKVYSPSLFSYFGCGTKLKRAVKDLSLCLKPGDRFGLLGVNGAGKSTTMAILTHDIESTSGTAYVAGLPLTDPNTMNHIGFCPQTDPLLDLMNAYETLFFFGRIRGIPEAVLIPRVEQLINDVGLSKHAHRTCGNYSGGNKRKLSLVVALIGDPKLLLLDEPSSGMDPEARRNMWEVIAKLSESRTLVLTTHSMEECEVLCSRMGIMVNGSLKCIGTSQRLKSKFGQGYEIHINCAVTATAAAAADSGVVRVSANGVRTSILRDGSSLPVAVAAAGDEGEENTAAAADTATRSVTNGIFEEFKLRFPAAIIHEQHGTFLNIHIKTVDPSVSAPVSVSSSVAADVNKLDKVNAEADTLFEISLSSSPSSPSSAPRVPIPPPVVAVVSTAAAESSSSSSSSTMPPPFNLADAFYYLQNLKDKEGKILDYSITQATLEQIFVEFAGGDPNHDVGKTV